MEIRYLEAGPSFNVLRAHLDGWLQFFPRWMGSQGGLGEQQHHVREWCNEQFPGRWEARGTTILIRDPADALAFKLRWV